MLSNQFEFLSPVFNAFRRKGFKLFLVGGCVRDFLLAKDSFYAVIKDFDLCTDASVEETQKILSRLDDCVLVDKNGGNFGTVMCTLGGEDVEITTFRKNEEYAAGSRRPDLDKLQFSDNVDDDLVRRDFTINAIAVDEHGALASPMCSTFLSDLKGRVLRSPQEPGTLMRDDPLRILRMYRFAHRLGFKVDPALRQASRNCATRLEFVKAERVLVEFTKILGGNEAHKALREMMEDGVLQQFVWELRDEVGSLRGGLDLPDWEATLALVEHVNKNAKGDYQLAVAALLFNLFQRDTGSVAFVLERMKFSTKDAQRVKKIVREASSWFGTEWDRPTARKFVNHCGEDFSSVVLLLEKVEENVAEVVRYENSVHLLKRILKDEDTAALVKLDTFLDGDDVQKLLRVPASPKLGQILKALKESVLKGSIQNKGEAVEWLTAFYS